MRIVSWNVNGILTINQYKPWKDLEDLEACLEHLQADMVCFQETKITRKSALSQRQICILPSFHSFFDFHPNRGYSGTVTYIRKAICSPLKSETGITGSLLPLQIRSNSQHSIGSYPEKCEEEMDEAMFKSLDAEGRSVVTDCGLFVLFNLYCPNLTNEERSEFKMNFYLCLEERIRNLLGEGREVIVVGDLNIVRDAIDHCEPSEAIRSAKEAGLSSFKETTQPRRWLDSMLQPLGPLHDVGRELHPTRTKFYTCWDTLRNSRPQNYGTRLDYTLLSPGIRDWVKGADIQADLMGSDHCPVFVDLFDEREIDGKAVELKDLLGGGVGKEKAIPPLATSNWPEFRGNQKTIKDLFARAQAKPAVLSQSSSSILPAPPTLLGASTSTPSSSSSVAGLKPELSLASTSQSTNSRSSSSSQAGSEVGSGLSSSLKRALSTTSASPEIVPSKKKKQKKVGQQKLKSYFTKEKQPELESEEPIASTSTFTAQRPDLESSIDSATRELLSTFPAQPDLDHSYSNTSPTKEDKQKWDSLFQKPTPPKCERHGEPATRWIVKKSGPNFGRAFWLCGRPVGEGYERDGKKNPSTEYRCNYFCWESDRPKSKGVGAKK